MPSRLAARRPRDVSELADSRLARDVQTQYYDLTGRSVLTWVSHAVGYSHLDRGVRTNFYFRLVSK